MGKVFFWMTESPDPCQIVTQTWNAFLDSMAAASVGVIVVITLLIVILYAGSAKRRRIHTPDDLFAAYTPMYWLLLAVVAAVVAGCTCAWQYHDLLPPESGGQISTSISIGVWTGLWTFVLGYLAILIPGITPAKFRYRPLWLFYHGKGARRA